MQEDLKKCHEVGYLTEEFAILAMAAAKERIFSGKNQNIPHCAKEEAFGNFCLKLTMKWEQIDPTKHPKAYLHFMAHNCLMDILRKFNSTLKKIDRVERDNDIKKGINNINVTPTKINIRGLPKDERAAIKRAIIKILKKDVSKCEIERKTGIPRRTLIRWEQTHKSIGTKFYQQDKREKRKKR